MTFEEFSKANLTRCEAPNGFRKKIGDWSTSEWLVAVMGELGEAANVVKKLNRARDGMPGNSMTEAELRAELRDELADVWIYLDNIAHSLGFDIFQAARHKWNKTSAKIGYPVELPV